MGKDRREKAPKKRRGWGEKRNRKYRMTKEKCRGCGSWVHYDELNAAGRCGFCR